MSYSKRIKAKGEKLQLSWWAGGSTAKGQWRKKIKGKHFYFRHPDTKAGYEEALSEYFAVKNQLSEDRPNFSIWNNAKEVFGKVQDYYDRFGIPSGEAKIAKEVGRILTWLDEEMKKPNLSPIIWLDDFEPVSGFRKEFNVPSIPDKLNGEDSVSLYLGSENHLGGRYEFSQKWRDRINRLEDDTPKKHPQTVEHWLTEWEERTKIRQNLTKYGKDGLKYKIKPFEEWVDEGQHVSKVDEVMLEDYHAHLETKKLSKESKDGYFRVFKSWVFWASSQPACEMVLPKNMQAKIFGFREPMGVGRKREAKKKLLWSPAEFKRALKKLPDRYKAYVLLFLNCGFRHVDVSELLKEDVRLNEGRIVIQRNKLNQQDTAPVVSYPLWPKTLKYLQQEMAKEGKYVFLNEWGNQVEGSIKLWWKRNKEQYGDKRLDYIRKTGSTIINRYKRDLHHLYLGESLRSTADIHYNFADGEPSPDLDEAIAHLGAQFGLCEEPKKKVELTPEILEVLKEAGIEV